MLAHRGRMGKLRLPTERRPMVGKRSLPTLVSFQPCCTEFGATRAERVHAVPTLQA